MYKIINKLGSLVVFVGVSITQVVKAEAPDWTDYNHLLQNYVSPGQKAGIDLNLIDYKGWAGDPAWKRLLETIRDYPLQSLETREQTIGFYINIYNILAIKTVIDNSPLDSIRDAGTWLRPVWKRPAGVLGGSEVTLHHIEHEILRNLDEPRIHMAIVCASVSCPDLATQAYTSAKLDAELDEQSRWFLHNDGKGLSIKENRIVISKIFKWFEEDFDKYGGVQEFIRRYREIPADTSLSYLDYDWSLNAD